jgi:GAF domain-containing protein
VAASLICMSENAQIAELAKSDGFRRQFTVNMLTGILEAVMRGTRADMGNIQLYDPKARRLRIYVQRGFRQRFLDFFDSVHLGEPACGSALKAARRVIVSDVTDSPIFPSAETMEVMLDAGVRSVQSTPVMSKSGVLLGMLSTHYRAVGGVAGTDLRLIDHFASRAAGIIEWQNRNALCRREVCSAVEA